VLFTSEDFGFMADFAKKNGKSLYPSTPSKKKDVAK